jgi:hypothetical protein
MARCWFELVCQLERELLCPACRRTGAVTLLLVDIAGTATVCLFVCLFVCVCVSITVFSD